MANENTARRGVYLPPELDAWFIAESERTGKKINALMLEAMEEFMNKNTAKGKRAFRSEIHKIVDAYLDSRGG